jgi:dynein heavy chain
VLLTLQDGLTFITATANATEKKEAASLKSVEVEDLSKIISAEKAEVDEALALALPELEAARLALSELDESDITEIR